MTHNKFKLFALLGIATACSGIAFAQTAPTATPSPAPTSDSQALINVLIKKGVLTNDEAKEISAEAARNQSAMNVETSNDSFLQKLALSGRFQEQYVGLGTSISGTAVGPVSTEHFIFRRMLVGVSAQFTDGFSGAVVYDLANDSFDKINLEWKQSDLFALDGGLQKAPFGYEEQISSGDLKAIERSALTRYIDEPNNGRRLGAASYRTGIFAHGTMDGFFYNVAFTNPERNEYSGDSTNTAILVNGQGGVGSTGNSATNKFAYYGTVGYAGSLGDGIYKTKYKFGYEAGYDNNQGGPGATTGTGRNIVLSGVFGDVTVGAFNLMAEWEQAQDDRGASATQDAKPFGYWIQPSYKLTPKWEAVVNYSYVDSEFRGVALSDVIRSAPSGGTMNTVSAYYYGINYYIKGNDVKLQFGYVHGESDNTIKGAPAKATTDGARSQVQIQF
jgi:Phosphate-selective porin O and P